MLISEELKKIANELEAITQKRSFEVDFKPSDSNKSWLIAVNKLSSEDVSIIEQAINGNFGGFESTLFPKILEHIPQEFVDDMYNLLDQDLIKIKFNLGLLEISSK